MLNRLSTAFDGAVEFFGNCFHYVNEDQHFYFVATDWAIYTFIITSVILMLVMLIARPRDMLEMSLAIRQGLLAAIFAIPVVAKWEGWRIPQWLAVVLLISISVTSVLVIISILKEYFWSYWESRSE